MARRQLAFSILCIVGSVAGLFAILRRVLIGFDTVVWVAFGLMFLLVWIAMMVMRYQPVTSEPIVRLQSAPRWQELSFARRHVMLILDWPLFSAIREREAVRLFNEELTCVGLTPSEVILVPLETAHAAPYFLRTVARVAARHGLRINNVMQGVFGPRFKGKKIELSRSGNDDRIWNNLRRALTDGSVISLRQFYNAWESAYLSTLTDDERGRYYAGKR
jgi:hypothetical protein